MSETVTETQQIQLVSIITISESKLVKNFQILLKQLRRTNERIDVLDKKISDNTVQTTDNLDGIRQHSHQLQSQIIQLHTEIGSVSNNLTSLSTDVAVKSGEHNMKIVDVELMNKQLNTKIESVDKDLTCNFQQINNEQMKIQDIIKTSNNKQGLHMQRISKEVEMLVMKNQSNIKKEKIVQERVSTLEKQMAGEETVRLQDIITDRVMRQIRKSPISVSHHDLSKQNLLKKQVRINFKQQGQVSLHEKSERQVPSEKRISMKTMEIRNSIRAQNQGGYLIPGEFLDISEIKSSLDSLKNKMKVLELSNNTEPLSVLIETFKKDIAEIKVFGEEAKKDISKLKTDSSAINLTQKIQELRPELNKLWGVIAGTEDKNLFLERKLEQMKKVLGQVSVYVKQNNMSRYDEKIRMIQSDLFSQIKQIIGKLELKTNNSDFFKYTHQSEENFRDIRATLANKCEKVQVKKALLFIQSKIKQIILVISQDEEYEKDALLTKKQIKCVSCDKQLDKQNGLVNIEPRNWNMMPQKEMQPETYGKCGISRFGSLASKIRKLEGSQLPLLKSKAKDKENKDKQPEK